ncbi:unnamed protein product [Fraxinus pennsylvanica]|uniref:Uncharacterized protein n=1 Tax=Fraxinus pennsylvanica TaxID=56036 RepID=A0AAD1ZZD4_9LAMI|nr:unnamed protein product [Fraxinus pennsylvanica]
MAATISVSPVNHSPSPPIFPSDVPVPGKAHSKRSLVTAPCDWSSRLFLFSAPPSSIPLPPNTDAGQSPVASQLDLNNCKGFHPSLYGILPTHAPLSFTSTTAFS